MRRRLIRWRVACSRALARLFLGREEMVCAWADWLRWRSRHLLNLIFFDRGHCEAAADWEAFTAPDATADYRFTSRTDQITVWRRGGWM